MALAVQQPPSAWTEEPKPGEPVNGLQAELLLDRTSFKMNEAIPLHVVLHNVSDQPLAVFRDLIPIVNGSGEIFFIVETDAGESRTVHFGIDDRPGPGLTDFAHLEPGQSVAVELQEPLTPERLQAQPGQYRLRVKLNIYADQASGGKGHWLPVEHAWTGILISNPVTIEVVESEARGP